MKRRYYTSEDGVLIELTPEEKIIEQNEEIIENLKAIRETINLFYDMQR